jgi:hypothetical protein
MAYSVWFADSAEIGSMKAETVLSVGSKGPKIDIEIRLSEILLDIKEWSAWLLWRRFALNPCEFQGRRTDH